MNEKELFHYHLLLGRACAAWGNPPQWVNGDFSREYVERKWAEFLHSCVPAEEYRNAIDRLPLQIIRLADIPVDGDFRAGTDYANDRLNSAFVKCGEISFRIVDPFAAYLAERKNMELYSFLHGTAERIRVVLAGMESRVDGGAL